MQTLKHFLCFEQILLTSNASELGFENVEVPAENILGSVNGGVEVLMSLRECYLRDCVPVSLC